MISRQNKVFNKLADERLEEMNELGKKVDPDKLIYRCKDLTADVKFD